MKVIEINFILFFFAGILDLWTETEFTKAPFQEHTDFLAVKQRK